MLILKRNLGDGVVMQAAGGPVIQVRVVELRGGGVRLGIEAPPEVKVLRSELLGIDPAADLPPLVVAPAVDSVAGLVADSVPAVDVTARVARASVVRRVS